MTLLFTDSAANNGRNKYVAVNWSSTTVRGTYGYSYDANVSNINQGGGYDIPASATLYMAAQVYNNTIITAGFRFDFMWFQFNATKQIALAINSNNALVVTLGSTVLATSNNNAIDSQKFVHVQFKATASDSSGSFDVWVEGNLVSWASGSNTGVATATTGVSTFNRVYYTTKGNGAAGDYTKFDTTAGFYYDSLAVWNNSGSGNFSSNMSTFSIKYDKPTGNGASSMMLGSDGNSVNNYQLLNTTTSTNSLTANVNDLDTYTHGTVSSGVTILGIASTYKASKTDAGACTLAPVVYSGGTAYNLNTISPSVTESFMQSFTFTDPITSAAFTSENYNGYQIGTKRTA